jgi:hypothetical protein
MSESSILKLFVLTLAIKAKLIRYKMETILHNGVWSNLIFSYTIYYLKIYIMYLRYSIILRWKNMSAENYRIINFVCIGKTIFCFI